MRETPLATDGQKDQNVDRDQSDRDGVRTARTGRGGLLGNGGAVHVSTVLALRGEGVAIDGRSLREREAGSSLRSE